MPHDPDLRHAWTNIIRGADYDAHMAAVGQAQANADLVQELFRDRPPAANSRILFAGAGTGQMFDFLPAGLLAPCLTTFTDINPEYLDMLRRRLSGIPKLRFEAQLDDIECSTLPPGFSLIVAVLLLEHVDWQAAIASLCSLSADRVFVVLQENPPHLETALTRSRAACGSMAIFQQLDSHLVSADEVEQEFLKHGFEPCWKGERSVPDDKKMLAREFRRPAPR
jgi:hypothetical protein